MEKWAGKIFAVAIMLAVPCLIALGIYHDTHGPRKAELEQLDQNAPKMLSVGNLGDGCIARVILIPPIQRCYFIIEGRSACAKQSTEVPCPEGTGK